MRIRLTGISGTEEGSESETFAFVFINRKKWPAMKKFGLWIAVATVLVASNNSFAQSRSEYRIRKSAERSEFRIKKSTEETRVKRELDRELSAVFPGGARDRLLSNPNLTFVSAAADELVSATDGGAGDVSTVGGESVGGENCSLPNGDCVTCCEPRSFWEHRSSVYAEYLYLSARNVDLTYATPVDGTTLTAVRTGPLGIVNPNYNSGFRLGAAWACDSCSSVTANYTFFQSHISDSINRPGGTGFIRSEVTHPNTTNVAADSLSASADYDIDFQMIDLNYKAILKGSDYYSLNYLLGVRYSHLDQDFQALNSILGTTSVNTEINFDGVGPRFGLDGERLIGGGFLVYGRGFANFLVGNFSADYTQRNVFAGVQGTTSFSDSRIVPVLETELGLGWQNCCGNFRVTGGYYLATWLNTVTTPSWIGSIKGNEFKDVSEALTFDGLQVRAEYRF